MNGPAWRVPRTSGLTAVFCGEYRGSHNSGTDPGALGLLPLSYLPESLRAVHCLRSRHDASRTLAVEEGVPSAVRHQCLHLTQFI